VGLSFIFNVSIWYPGGYRYRAGGMLMPTYISLVNLTEQGIKEVKNAPERLRFFDEAAKEVGARLIGFYLVMGQYDYVIITEAPDDQTAARLILGSIAQGSIRTQTMRAFPRDEFENIARSMH
jgi:uncharacterized protein with GYD domain